MTERIHQLGGQPALRSDGTTEPIVYDGRSELRRRTAKRVLVRIVSQFTAEHSHGPRYVTSAAPPQTGILFLNCTDCATAVVTFANSLGCALTIRNLSIDVFTSFRLNTYWLIGLTEPEKEADLPFPDWAFHEVGEESNEMYDATAKLDSDSEPHAFPARFELTRGNFVSERLPESSRRHERPQSDHDGAGAAEAD